MYEFRQVRTLDLAAEVPFVFFIEMRGAGVKTEAASLDHMLSPRHG